MKMTTVFALLAVVVLTTCATRSRSARAQKAPDEKAAAPAPAAKKAFPAGWAGTYRGKLEVVGADGKRQTLNMEFIIAPTAKKDRVRWVIGYEGQPKRNYELVTLDAAKGLYKIDEKNSIEISAQLIGDELISIFAVTGNQLVARYRLIDRNTLAYEIIMWKQQATGMSGGQGGIPVVTTYSPKNVQKAVLTSVVK